MRCGFGRRRIVFIFINRCLADGLRDIAPSSGNDEPRVSLGLKLDVLKVGDSGRLSGRRELTQGRVSPAVFIYLPADLKRSDDRAPRAQLTGQNCRSH